MSPGSQPVTPHHNRTRTRSKSSGAPRRRKLEKSFSTGVMMMMVMMMMMMMQDAGAPIPHIFSYVGWEWAAWIVRVGALMGLTARYKEMLDGGSTHL